MSCLFFLLFREFSLEHRQAVSHTFDPRGSKRMDHLPGVVSLRRAHRYDTGFQACAALCRGNPFSSRSHGLAEGGSISSLPSPHCASHHGSRVFVSRCAAGVPRPHARSRLGKKKRGGTKRSQGLLKCARAFDIKAVALVNGGPFIVWPRARILLIRSRQVGTCHGSR